MTITADHLEEYRRHGYVVIENFLDEQERRRILSRIHQALPSWEAFDGSRESHPNIVRDGTQIVEFPFEAEELNHVGTHPELITFAEQVLGSDDVFLTQSLVWGKYAGIRDFDQPLHCDWSNNSLVVPRADDDYPQLAMILYYTDVALEGGPTHVVSRTLTADRPIFPHERHRDLDPDLYELEQPLVVKGGSILCFSMRTYHRGSRVLAPTGARFTHHFVWRRGGQEWMSWRGWGQFADSARMTSWLAKADVRQRSVLGFPRPGHPYWTEQTVSDVGRRYPGIDMTPYRMSTHDGGV